MLHQLLKEDRYFYTLFLVPPVESRFQLHQFEWEAQSQRLKLNLHTPLLPDKLPSQQNNFSSIHLIFSAPSQLKVNLTSTELRFLTFKLENKSHLKVMDGPSVVLDFQFDGAKLEKWLLYLNDV
jgi:hypothetical protein